MAHGSKARRAERAAIRAIRVKVEYKNPDIQPVDYVLEGTTRELLDWVGTSDIRAKRVLARELAQDTPRIKLVAALHELLQIESKAQ